MSQGLALTALSVLALAAGAILPRWLRGGLWTPLVNGLVLAAVGGLVALVVIPETVQHAGPLALIAAVLGVLLPRLLERNEALGSKPRTHFALGAALIALLLHTALDGMGLATADRPGGSGPALALAIVAHRFPVGLALWLVVAPRYGGRRAALVLTVVGAATFVGFFLGDALLPRASDPRLQLFQAFVAGSLLHVVLHAPDQTTLRHWRPPEFFGAALGLTLVLLMPEAHSHGDGGLHRFGEAFLHLSLDVAPALLAGFLLAALLHKLSAGKSGAVPLIEPPALLASVPLLGLELSLARVVASTMVLGVLYLARRLLGAPSADPETVSPPESGARAALRYGFGDLMDEAGPWLLLGLALAAALPPGSWVHGLATVPRDALVWLFAALGLALSINSVGATAIAGAFIAAGLSPGAGLAILLTGPALEAKTLSAFRARRAGLGRLIYLAAVVLMAGGAGMLTDRVVNRDAVLAATRHAHGTIQSPWVWLSLGVLALAVTRSIWVKGPGGYARAILQPKVPQRD